MQLRCPYCRSLVGLPDAMRRYFGMPVTCHDCRHAFVVPPQNPLHDAAIPADTVRPLDRSISAVRCSHEHGCRRCGHRFRIAGLDPPPVRISLACPYCDAPVGYGGPRGLAPGAVVTVLILGILAGGRVLWLDHQGLIALRNLEASQLLLEWKHALRRLGLG